MRWGPFYNINTVEKNLWGWGWGWEIGRAHV